jgi:hypothetical protein
MDSTEIQTLITVFFINLVLAVGILMWLYRELFWQIIEIDEDDDTKTS